jgi:hypothetical protein
MKILCGIFLMFFTFSSFACSCRQNLETYYENAKSAHLISVTSATLKNDYVETKYNVIEHLLNGDKDPKSVKVKNNNCSLQLYPGNEYVIFIPKEERFENTVSMCTGIYRLNLFMPPHIEKLDEIKRFIKSME